MNINTEAAELLHAVADLYECGALKWVAFSTPDTDNVSMSLVVALLLCRSGYRRGMNSVYRAVATVADIVDDIHDWQCQRGRNTRHVISLLRKAARGLEQA